MKGISKIYDYNLYNVSNATITVIMIFLLKNSCSSEFYIKNLGKFILPPPSQQNCARTLYK